MNIQLIHKLEKLRKNFQDVTEYPFTHFFCPILFCDEDTPLQKGHVINQAFPHSSRKWTVQRQDVDEFYGSIFESDFSVIRYIENPTIDKTLTDKSLFKTLAPKISVDGRPIEYFIAQDKIPGKFIPVVYKDNDGQTIFLGLRISQEEFALLENNNFEIEVSKDIRISALVSLIKAAHLTLFDLLGYHYALSAGGYFVGFEILGKFFKQNKTKPKSEVLENAKPYFREFAHMVRPVLFLNLDMQGTLADKRLLLCKDEKSYPWAILVLIKISKMMHAVMVPVLDKTENVVKFLNFLKDDTETLNVSICQIDSDRWTTSKEIIQMFWPKSGTLYPDD